MPHLERFPLSMKYQCSCFARDQLTLRPKTCLLFTLFTIEALDTHRRT